MSKISEILSQILTIDKNDEITINKIINFLADRGFLILLLIFALPLSIPLPVPPGLTTILSLPLLFLTVQIIIGIRDPWLPHFISKRKISLKTFKLVLDKLTPTLNFIEKFSKSRLKFLCGKIGYKIFAIFGFICAVSIAIPLPLTNFIPAASIAIISLGLLNCDGVIVIIGYFIGLLGLGITSIIVILGPTMVMNLIDKFF